MFLPCIFLCKRVPFSCVYSSLKLLANLLNLYVSFQTHDRFIGDEDGMLHDRGVATFDKVLRVRARFSTRVRAMDDGSNIEKLIELQQQRMQQQITGQKEHMENQERRFLKQLERQESLHKAQMEALLSAVDKTSTVASTSFQGATPSFGQCDPLSELWADYLARFCTFVSAQSVFSNPKARIFLTNQALTTYKLLSN